MTRSPPRNPPAKAETGRNGGERRERSERRGVAAARPPGPDRGGGWGDGGVLAGPTGRDGPGTSGGRGRRVRRSRTPCDRRATARPASRSQYPASYAGMPTIIGRLHEVTELRRRNRGERR